ncbi:Hsp33 family molecular chaperone HslO [Bulleidia sp. zg-1006]|uniref:Hsp33 family molecular chaperone HslO n=1 Tax=Bulleidia sp. zg-1006 TaxID=2806552 RepID=UPI00193975AD|nr:Hsp33 family molecular chaperone HslO [Bulleidia sp. zg-1006]QRG87007.1 Hsp33 family molecular chaperone HslO [Bulleidia sp. zg-1006]
MKDKIVIAQAFAGQVRIRSLHSTNLVEEARKSHHLMATSAAALGRTLTLTAILASDLKNPKAKVTALFNGGGPIGTVLAQGDGSGHVRGFVSNPNIYLVREDGHLDVGAAIGQSGTLKVTKDLGLKEPFSGVVNIQSGEVGDDFAYYFAVSEQTPSIVGVGVLVNPEGDIRASGGMIFQLMPGASEETICALEEIARTMKPITELVDVGLSPEEMIYAYIPDAQILDEKEVVWNCSCSKEHYFHALTTLADKDLQEMIKEDHGAEVTCQFCHTKYQFSEDELKEIVHAKQLENR